MTSKSRIPTISLFSGAGGLDIGFLKEGFDIKACVEIEPSYATTLRANVHGGDGYDATTVVHCEDIRKFDTTPYREMGIRCVIGGPPCQTFSAAGRRSGGVIGLEDERGQLFLAYCRILDELRPEVFVFENVYGLPGANGGEPWRQMQAAFTDRGYKINAVVVDAADYGVPQHRERLIMVGHRSGSYAFPMPTHGPDSEDGLPLVSVKKAIADLQKAREPFHNDLGGMYGHLLPLVPEGLNYAYFTAEMGHPEPVFAWRSKFHDLLYKVNSSEPCRTIKAQPGKFTGPFHWKNRHFTIHELKRLQSFPDGYDIVGSFAKVVEQIGNSVPPALAQVIANSVREQLFSKARKLTHAKRPIGFVSTFRQRQRERSQAFKSIAAKAIERQYGKATLAARPAHASHSYYLNPTTLFDRRHHVTPNSLNIAYPSYAVDVSEEDRHVEIKFSRVDAAENAQISEVNISGLRKYLPEYDTVRLSGRIIDAGDIFHAWSAIEEALVQRSRFFTLIDIYGHYANRGDTVRVDANWKTRLHKPLVKAINFFEKTMRCGEFIDEGTVCYELGVNNSALSTIIDKMRAIRFDIRTSKTHPIIGKGRVLCTYPFPLLSPRALVESRVKFISPADISDTPIYASVAS